MLSQMNKSTNPQTIIETFTAQLVQPVGILRHLKQLPIVRSMLFRRAVEQAFQGFAVAHPDWVACLFDRHFLNQQTAQMMVQYQVEGCLPQPQAIALAWDAQLPYTPDHIRQRRLADLTLAADDFLRWLQEALDREMA